MDSCVGKFPELVLYRCDTLMCRKVFLHWCYVLDSYVGKFPAHVHKRKEYPNDRVEFLLMTLFVGKIPALCRKNVSGMCRNICSYKIRTKVNPQQQICRKFSGTFVGNMFPECAGNMVPTQYMRSINIYESDP